MEKMTKDEIMEVLRAHGLWIGDPAEGRWANLTGANLTGATLTGANLTDADLTDANLTRADLTGANLTRADLTDANLTGANLTGTRLAGADLTDANLTRADLTRADLTGATLTGAYLDGAYLAGANLTGARLRWQSHDLIAEILRQAAGHDSERLALTDDVRRYRDRCWDQWLDSGHPLLSWALDVLRPWAVGDPNAPKCLRKEEV
uniref:Pentapeptide repeat-containing protein n=2 Tax=viral metagenome TaxID=1070528 RepID=A0A6M3J9S7_9ZZZZ